MEAFERHKAGCYGVANVVPDPPLPPARRDELLAAVEASWRDHQGSLRYLRDRDRATPDLLEGTVRLAVGDAAGEGRREAGTTGDRGHADLDLSGTPPTTFVQPVDKALRDARAYHGALRREAVPPVRAARKALVGLVGALVRGRVRFGKGERRVP